MPAGKLVLSAKATKRFPVKKKIVLKPYRSVKRSKASQSSFLYSGGYPGGSRMGALVKDAFPSHNFRKMSYAWIGTMNAPTSTGALGAVQKFSLGNLYDVDISGSGHQPYGRDQMALLYHRYKVYGVTVDITTTAQSKDGMFMALKLLTPNDTDTLTGETYAVCAEDPKIRVKHMTDPNNLKTKWRFYVDIAKFMGMSKNQFESNIEDWSALYTTTTGPARRVDLEIAIAAPDGNAGSCLAAVVLTFHVKSWERTDFGQS